MLFFTVFHFMIRLILYTTLGCHLCESAQEIIKNSRHAEHVELELIEIADSSELIKRYGIRIPVVRLDGKQEEIGWPFDSAEFDDWLCQNLV